MFSMYFINEAMKTSARLKRMDSNFDISSADLGKYHEVFIKGKPLLCYAREATLKTEENERLLHHLLLDSEP